MSDETINYDNLVTMKFPRTHKCPICGYEDTANSEGVVGLTISVRDYCGHYCLNCWAKHVHDNVPKMEKIIPTKEGEAV